MSTKRHQNEVKMNVYKVRLENSSYEYLVVAKSIKDAEEKIYKFDPNIGLIEEVEKLNKQGTIVLL